MTESEIRGVFRARSSSRVVLSAPWSWSFPPPEDSADVHVVMRPSDWNLSPIRAAIRSVRGILSLVAEVRPGDHVVLATLGPTAGLYAAAVRVKRPASVAVFDFLYSPRGATSILRSLLRHCVSRFVVIRRGDRSMLERHFGIASQRVGYIPWAVSDASIFDAESKDGGYLYAAGWAHRDWPTLLDALRRYPVEAILAPGRAVPTEGLPEQVTIIDMPSPREGRVLAAKARAVAVLLQDCEFAAGPLVLLDAMALGKPIIVNDVNGNRDYVKSGVTALVVPPSDEVALSGEIERLWEDPELAARLGASAKVEAQRRYTSDKMWRALLLEVTDRNA